ncbi:hypothetical protein CRYUN_Cryun17cG0144400 [Craigia yunnanensis]
MCKQSFWQVVGEGAANQGNGNQKRPHLGFAIFLLLLCFVHQCFDGLQFTPQIHNLTVRTRSSSYVSSPVFLLTPKLQLTPSAFLVLVIGSAMVALTTIMHQDSREKCKKCGKPKEIAVMPAIAMPGASLRTYSRYFARAPGALEQKMNVGFLGSGCPQQSLPLTSNWSVGGADNYGLQSASTWPVAGNRTSGVLYVNPGNRPLSVPKGWQNGDWICNCGFHNYSSRSLVLSYSLNWIQHSSLYLSLILQNILCHYVPDPVWYFCSAKIAMHLYHQVHSDSGLLSNILFDLLFMLILDLLLDNGQPQLYPGFDQMVGTTSDPKPGTNPPYPSLNPGAASNWQAPIPFPHQAATPILLGKGAKQWRSGDWMCTKCNNHNYASRAHCNSIVELERDAELANTDRNAIPSTPNNTESQELNENCHDNCDANSIGSLKDEGDTNLLGSWKDEAIGLSEPVGEASTSGGVASGSPLVQTPVPPLSGADMAQEDELEEEQQQSESSKQIVNFTASTGELRISKDIIYIHCGIYSTECTFTAPQKWMRGKGLVTIQFGCCYNYAMDKNGNPPGILQNEVVDPISYLFKVVGPGEFSGSIAIPLPVGSVLVLNGNGADIAKHYVPAVPTKRISITFSRMDELKLPIGYSPEPDLQGIEPLSYDEEKPKRLNSPKFDRHVKKASI